MKWILIYTVTKDCFRSTPTGTNGRIQERMKNISLQIEPELTRRGISLKAIVFYATHFTFNQKNYSTT
jgi:hypothetical protein